MSDRTISFDGLTVDQMSQFKVLTSTPTIAWPTVAMWVGLTTAFLSCDILGASGRMPLWLGMLVNSVKRLGGRRGTALNPFAALLGAGVSLAFGSDSPVTPVDPWGAVRAAVHHRTDGFGISPRAAFTAHTRGGWRAAGDPDAGTLVPGAPATYAVWDAGELVAPPQDARWSTDPHSGLPSVAPGVDLPVCLRTVSRGRVIFDGGVVGS